MLRKIQLITAFSILLSACRDHVSQPLPDTPLKDSLESIYQKGGNSEKGFAAASAILKNTPDKDIASTLYYYNYAANVYYGKADYEKQAAYADSSLRLLNKPEYDDLFFKERATANLNKAYALYRQKRYTDCYNYFYEASAEAAKANDSTLTSNLNQYMAMFLYEEENYGKTIYYYRQLILDASGASKTYDRLMNNQGVQDNMGISFLKDNQFDSAIFYFKAAEESICQASLLKPANDTTCRTALAVMQGNLAQAYAVQKQYDSAEILYRQSIAINRQPGFANEDALITQQHLAEMYFEQKNAPLFHTTLAEMKTGLDTISNKKVELYWNIFMNRYYVMAKQPAKALAYLDHYIYLRDSARNARKVAPKDKSDIFDQMKNIQSKYEVTMLRKDNEANRLYLWVAIVLFFLVLIIAALTFFLLRKSRKNVAALTTLNNKINHKQILLEDTLTQLEKENREKQHILHVVAHDLRNPISSIHALALMTEDEYEDEDAARENLAMIKTACTNSSELISGILEIAENEEIKYACSPVDVNAWLSNIMALLRVRAKEKNQRLSLMTSKEKGLVYADVEKLNRVLTNIVTNAIKFSPAGSHIDISAMAFEEHITIQVKDEGIGIPEQYRNTIFEAFTEAKRSGTEGEKTFGLGLSISKQIIEKHHGSIWFDSRENEGATFFIRLPRLKDVLMPVTETTASQNKLLPAVNPVL